MAPGGRKEAGFIGKHPYVTKRWCILRLGKYESELHLGPFTHPIKGLRGSDSITDPVTPGRCRGNTMRESVILPRDAHTCLSAMPGIGFFIFALFLSFPGEDPNLFAGGENGGVGSQRERALWGAEAAKL